MWPKLFALQIVLLLLHDYIKTFHRWALLLLHTKSCSVLFRKKEKICGRLVVVVWFMNFQNTQGVKNQERFKKWISRMHGQAMPSSTFVYISKRSGQNLLALFFEDIYLMKSQLFSVFVKPWVDIPCYSRKKNPLGENEWFWLHTVNQPWPVPMDEAFSIVLYGPKFFSRTETQIKLHRMLFCTIQARLSGGLHFVCSN